MKTKTMTVAHLKSILADLHDGDYIVVAGGDHSYRGAEAHCRTAIVDRRTQRDFWEDFGDRNPPELSETHVRVNVLVIE